MIGVIMIVHNEEQFLNEALESLTVQTSEFRVFAIDGGSTDKTPEILEEYFHRWRGRLVYKRYEERRGPAPDFNSALEMALNDNKVKYIIKLDGDDYFLPFGLDNLKLQLEVTGADVVYADHKALMYDNGKFIFAGNSNSPSPEDITPGRLIRGFNVISGGSVIAKREVYEDIGGWDETLAGGWDVEWYIRALISGYKFAKYNKPVYVHRIYPESLFGESISGDLFKSRWMKWRKQLWDRRAEYRRQALRRCFP